MNLEFWAMTFDFIGKFLLASLVLIVHGKIRKEKKIDTPVLKDIKIELILGVVSLVFLVMGYTLNLYIL